VSGSTGHKVRQHVSHIVVLMTFTHLPFFTFFIVRSYLGYKVTMAPAPPCCRIVDPWILVVKETRYLRPFLQCMSSTRRWVQMSLTTFALNGISRTIELLDEGLDHLMLQLNHSDVSPTRRCNSYHHAPAQRAASLYPSNSLNAVDCHHYQSPLSTPTVP
jgi:hypothetical protein